MPDDVYLIDACRTPIGKLGGVLARVRPDDLAAHAMGRLMARNPAVDPAEVEDVHWGATNQAGEDNRDVARIAWLLAGLPLETGGVTVNRLCGSSLQATIQAGHALAAGWGDVAVAGGSESMSRAPLVMMTKPTAAYRPGLPEMADTTLGWRLVNPRWRDRYRTLQMGETAEEVADRWGIGREEQDRFALASHERALAAIEAGRFADEIEPLEAPQDDRGRDVLLVDTDEGPRADTNLEALGRLRPVFREGGTVTAGNASQMNDGAAAVLLATGVAVERLGLEPMARIVSSAVAGVHPDIMGTGPIPATRKALDRAGLTIEDIGLVELNEAFAAQAIACERELGLDHEIVNVNGGAIANGHPLGASGAKILTTLLWEMRRREVRHGLATMCIGVGQGVALVVERV
ncbi:MAG: thiolase family protein [Acidimicrobiia bacterium]